MAVAIRAQVSRRRRASTLASLLLVGACSTNAAHDAGVDAPIYGRPCRTSAECVQSQYYTCSYQTPGCDVMGMCIGRRLCQAPGRFCGCDGQTFATEVCYQGIPNPWVHAGPCDLSDAGPPCETNADCMSGEICTWPTAGCTPDVRGYCIGTSACDVIQGQIVSYCSCAGATITAANGCFGANQAWTHMGACGADP